MATREDLERKIDKLEVNMDRTDRIVNGTEAEDVMVDGGVLVPSIRKWQKELEEEYGIPSETLERAEDAASRAEGAAIQAEGFSQEASEVVGTVTPRIESLEQFESDLSDPDKGAAMVAKSVLTVDRVSDLSSLPVDQKKEGLRYLVAGSVFRWMGDWSPVSEFISSEAFGVVPGGSYSVDQLQEAVDFATANGMRLWTPPGEYSFNTSANHHNDYAILELRSNLVWDAKGAHFRDLIVQSSSETRNVEINYGRFFNSRANTLWLFSLRGKRFRFNQTVFDQEGPATSNSPWVYIRDTVEPENQSEDFTFYKCRFLNRTNVHVWNARDVLFDECHMRNKVREDGVVIKSRKGRGLSENISVRGGTYINTTGVFAAGTEMGDDVQNLRADGVTLIEPQCIALLKPNDSVTTLPELRGGHIRDVFITDTTIYAQGGGNWVGGLQIRLSDGSTVSNVEVKGVIAKVRGMINTSAATLHYQVNSGAEGFVKGVSMTGFQFESVNPGAENPGDLDVYGVQAQGYAVNSLLRIADSYTLGTDSLEDVFIEGRFSGIAQQGVVTQSGVRWGNVVLERSVFSSLSPRGAVVLRGEGDVDVAGITVRNAIDQARLIGKVGSGSLTANRLNSSALVCSMTVADVSAPLLVADRDMVLLAIDTSFQSELPSGGDYVFFNVRVKRAAGGPLENLFVPANRKNTSGGVPALAGFRVWDGDAIGSANLNPVLVRKGDVVTLDITAAGAGHTIPLSNYTVSYIPASVTLS